MQEARGVPSSRATSSANFDSLWADSEDRRLQSTMVQPALSRVSSPFPRQDRLRQGRSWSMKAEILNYDAPRSELGCVSR